MRGGLFSCRCNTQIIKLVMDCFASPFSAVIKFQKQFVDDVLLNVKKQSDQLNRRNHELRNRKMRLYLDHLEEEYLCCVCGKPGEEPEVSGVVSDEFRIVHMPCKEQIESAIFGSDGNDGSLVALGEERPRTPAPRVHAFLGIFSTVTEPSVSEMVARVQCSVRNKSAAERQKKAKKFCHRDRGLLKIEESNINMFEHFFGRPVHGYLCWDCHNSAKKRLDALTRQIKIILYKGKNPFLRGHHDMDRVIGGQDLSTSASLLVPTQSELCLCKRRGSKFTLLSNSTITDLRNNVRCAVCKRRQAAFFIRQGVIFLCQFCCARDRFYRDNATCLNDEFMPRETAHLLKGLASCYKKAMDGEGRGLLPTSTPRHHIDLFLEHNTVDLFLAYPAPHTIISVRPTLHQTASLSDQRRVAGSMSVSLFAGKEFQWNLS